MDNEILILEMVDQVEKISVLANAIKFGLITPPQTAQDWMRIGYAIGNLSRCVDRLSLDMIAVSHDMYNPIPGVKLTDERK